MKFVRKITFIFAVSFFVSCSFFTSKITEAQVNSIDFSKRNTTIGVGGIDYLKLSINPESSRKSVTVRYEYDNTIISVNGDNNGATVSGLKNGNTMLKAIAGNASTVCIVTVMGTDEAYETAPQITSSTIALELEKTGTKRVQVSLTNSTASDMADFVWTIDKPEIASVEGAGQIGVITGLENGIARVTVTHAKALYSYKFTVFVKPEAEKAYYITTAQNILTIDRNASSPEKNILVSLVNGTESENAQFSWISSPEGIISLTANRQNCVITPQQPGTATITVSHPKSAYPLEIVVRVVSIVNNVYIEPSTVQVTINGTNPATVTAKLEGMSSYDSSEFVWKTEDSNLLQLTPFQDSCGITALGNGMTKILVSHPNAKYSREILVIINGHPSGSINGSMYITTTQNYIRTKVGASETRLDISLVGGIPGDEKNFIWTVDKPELISLTTTHGTVSRTIFDSRADGTAYINPKKEGIAVITVVHPKIVVPTEIMVVVLAAGIQLTDPFYFTGQSVIGIVVGKSEQVTVILNGNNKTPSDDSDITWKSENNSIAQLSGVNDNTATITAVGVGEMFVSVTHPKVDNTKKILIYTAATEEELAAKRVLYTSKNHYNIVAGGDSDRLSVYSIGLKPEEISGITWSNSNPAAASIKMGSTNEECLVSGISTGKTTITASHPLCATPVTFEITVFPAGTDLGVVPSPAYFTTSQNLVQFNVVNQNKTVSVIPIRLAPEEYSKIIWDVEDSDICEVIPNGTSATVTSLKEGATKIFVSHPKAENILPITIRVGNEYIIPPITTPYITSSQDVVGLVKGQSGVQLKASLINATSKGFNWTIDDTAIATINPLDNTCFVVPKEAGQACVTITNSAVPGVEKKVLILVGNSSEELESIPYLSTSQNVITMGIGSQQNVSVRVVNAGTLVGIDYTWSIQNPALAQVVSSGNQAVIKALEAGTTKILIRSPSCVYPLEIIIDVKQQLSSSVTDPYITTSQNIITVTEGSANRALKVTLVGGNETDNSDFIWALDRSDIVTLVSNGDNAVIKPIAKGECLISVSHPKAMYQLQIKVIVEAKVTNPGLYIKVNPADIITMKPADPEKTVTASLIGGTAEDAYGFKWSADNYNSIKLTSSGATAIITPISEGTTNIKITHPKAGFPAELQVRITEYSTFSFSATNMTINEGETQFISMKVPAVENDYNGRVVYATDNSKIITISGTNKVAQLTAVGSGTATVTATSPSGAKSEMMVYVKKAAEQTKPYITSATNVLALKTTDSARTISAQLVGQGVLPTDQYNLQWEIEDTKIARLIGTSGTTVYVQPVAAGETTLKISHPNTTTVYRMYVNVQGTENGLSLNKTYLSLETGKTIEVSALIDNGTSADYQAISWTADKVNGRDICSILGSGKTVAIYGLAAGQTKITAEWKGKTAKCDVKIDASRQFVFDTQTMRVQPGQTKTFKYTLVPDDSPINWITNSNDYVSYSVDTSSKTVSITGIAEAPTGTAITTLTGNANSMIASINITTAWDYSFTLGKSTIVAEPRYDATNPSKFVIPYTCNPSDATISVQLTNPIATYVIDTNRKEIILTPTGEGTAILKVTAKNTKTGQMFPNMERSVNLNFSYTALALVASVTHKTGNFSNYNKDVKTLYLGDGENVDFSFAIAEPNVGFTVETVTLQKSVADSITTVIRRDNTFTISHSNDVIKNEYLIQQGYVPLLHLTESVSGTETNPSNFGWDYSQHWLSKSCDYTIYQKNPRQYFYDQPENMNTARKRDTTLDGMRMSISQFQSNPWYYRPAYSGHCYYDSRETGNIVAALVPILSKALESSVQTDIMIVTVLRNNGKRDTFRIPIILQTRNCTKDQI